MSSFYKLLSFNLVVIFVYAIIYQQIKTHFYGLDEDSSFLDCLYLSFTIQSTVGFGDIGPKTKISKINNCKRISKLYDTIQNSFS